MSTRRSFIKKSLLSGLALSLPLSPKSLLIPAEKPKVSLAQWSLNRAIRNGSIKAEDFAAIAKNTYGIDAVEYVSSFYAEQKQKGAYWADLLKRSDSEGVNNLLIMIDDEGELGSPDQAERVKAVKNHHGWVDVAKTLQCHSIRVNAFGTGSKRIVKAALIDGLGRLCEYGASAGINILIENHGLYSSEADFMVEVIKAVGSPFMGTLPDFGNWCTSEKWGGTRDDSCKSVYDQALGVKQFLPYAKGVSAKSYDFDVNGGQARINYPALLKLVKDAGYTGHIGIEYEGENLSEAAGIRATQALIAKTWSALD